jgi:hypothetical protein
MKQFAIPAALALALACTACGGTEEAPPDPSASETPEAAATEEAIVEEVDAATEGTEYHDMMDVGCGINGNEPNFQCKAGIVREWGEDRTTLVDVVKPDGTSRALFFLDGEVYGADAAEADGSAAYDLTFTSDGVNTTIVFGPETYVIPYAFVLGV